MTNILVTGSDGQLGKEIDLRKQMVNSGRFTCVDIEDLDLANEKEVAVFFKSNSFDYIINCAAYTAVDHAETDQESAKKANIDLVHNLIKYGGRSGARILHISTDYVFDGSKKTPYIESDPTNPLTVYGQTKLMAEELVLAYPEGMIIRTSWLYSPFGQNFLKSIIRKAKQEPGLKVVNDQYGTPTYAGHLAQSILWIINAVEKGMRFIPGMYHYSNMGSCTWYDFACAIVEELDLNVMIEPVDTAEYITAAKRPAYSVLSKEKIIKTYKLKIEHWKEGLIECLKNLSN